MIAVYEKAELTYASRGEGGGGWLLEGEVGFGSIGLLNGFSGKVPASINLFSIMITL